MTLELKPRAIRRNTARMDGPGTVIVLQKICRIARCSFTTVDPAPDAEQSRLQMGAPRVFEKPFAFAEVMAALEQLVAGRLGNGKMNSAKI